MIKSLISKLKGLLETQCERCNNLATQHIKHTISLGRSVNFLGQVINHQKIQIEAVCENCFNEQKRLDEIQFLQIVQQTEEYKNKRHHLSHKYVEERLNELYK